jgi:hypothetical protein
MGGQIGQPSELRDAVLRQDASLLERRDRRDRRKRPRRREHRWQTRRRTGRKTRRRTGGRRIPIAATTAQVARCGQPTENPTHCDGGPGGCRPRPTEEAEQPGRQERLSTPKALPAVDAVTRLENSGRSRIVGRIDFRLVFDRADARLFLPLFIRFGRLLRERWTNERRQQDESDDL